MKHLKHISIPALVLGLLATLHPASAAGLTEVTLAYDWVSPAAHHAIPDGEQAPTVLELDLAGTGLISIQSVELDLRLAGTAESPGFAGDLVVYLARNSGLTSYLLNRVGATSGDASDLGLSYSGWNVTFSDQALHADIHDAVPGGDLLVGTWIPDARAHPESPTDLSQYGLSIYTGAPADGPWWLALADVSPGGTVWLEQATLRLTGFAESTIPEPTSTGFLAAGLLLAPVLLRFHHRRSASAHPPHRES